MRVWRGDTDVYTGNGWVAFEWVEGRDEGTLRSGMAIVTVA